MTISMKGSQLNFGTRDFGTRRFGTGNFGIFENTEHINAGTETESAAVLCIWYTSEHNELCVVEGSGQLEAESLGNFGTWNFGIFENTEHINAGTETELAAALGIWCTSGHNELCVVEGSGQLEAESLGHVESSLSASRHIEHLV